MHVVHHGVDAEAFAPVPQPRIDAVRRRHGIPGRYVLFVGGIEPRKNLEQLVTGVRRERRAGSLAGDRRRAGAVVPGGDRATGRGHRVAPDEREGARIVRTGYVNERDKLALLSGATVLAYPSIYEGFGFPVLEAFAAGVPVMTSNVSSLARGGRRGRGSGGSRGRPRDREGALGAGRRRGPPGGAVRCGGGTGVAIHLGGNGSRDRRRLARGRRGVVTAPSDGSGTAVDYGSLHAFRSRLQEVPPWLPTRTSSSRAAPASSAPTWSMRCWNAPRRRSRCSTGSPRAGAGRTSKRTTAIHACGSSSATSSMPGWSTDSVADADSVIHAAAESHVDRSIDDPGSFLRTNVSGTQVRAGGDARARRPHADAFDGRGLRAGTAG